MKTNERETPCEEGLNQANTWDDRPMPLAKGGRGIRESTPDPLILAIQQGMGPEQISKIIDLQERIAEAKARAAYNMAMAACQREMPVVVRDRENTHTHSRYATIDVVASTMRPIYTKHGLSLCYTEGPSPGPGMMQIRLNVRHELGHGEWFQLDLPVDGVGSQGKANAMNPLQARGSTTAYGRRYLAYMAFNLVIANEDIDGNAYCPTISDEERQKIEAAIVDRGIDAAKFIGWTSSLKDSGPTLADIPEKHLAEVWRQLNRKKSANATAKP